MKLCSAFVSPLVLVLLLSGTAVAWNAPGHMVVGLIAYDRLDPATRAKVLDILRAHPRFEQHFLGEMPPNVWKGSDAEKDQWLFAQAAVWPDIVRSESPNVTKDDVLQFNHPTWHYIDIPLFLNDDERQKLAGAIRINLSRDILDDTDEQLMNCVQAVKNSSGVVRQSAAPPADRAIQLCWLFHLVGDTHQPLHSTALYTSHRFPEGDQGGNLLMIRGQKRLHGYWDEAIMQRPDFNQVRRETFDLLHDKELTAAGERAASSVDVGDWIDESHELAKKYVYTDHVLRMVADAESRENLGSLNPPRSYYLDAGPMAKRRAVEAGYRLAKLLQELLQ